MYCKCIPGAVMLMHPRRFALFLPLHHLWMGYMSELMELAQPNTGKRPGDCMLGSAGMHAKLVKADLHGSILTGMSSGSYRDSPS